MKCNKCGQELGEGVLKCPICGELQNELKSEGISSSIHEYNDESTCNTVNKQSEEEVDIQDTKSDIEHLTYYQQKHKSRFVAGMLQIFFGGFGIGRFYLGYNGMALGQLFTFPIFFIGGIWGFIDGILILCGQVECDASGIPLK